LTLPKPPKLVVKNQLNSRRGESYFFPFWGKELGKIPGKILFLTGVWGEKSNGARFKMLIQPRGGYFYGVKKTLKGERFIEIPKGNNFGEKREKARANNLIPCGLRRGK